MKENAGNDDAFRSQYGKALSDLKLALQKECPTAESLMQYYKKQLSSRKQRVLEKHIDLCPLCLEALNRLERIEREENEEGVLPENWERIEKDMDEQVYAYLNTISSTKPSKISTGPSESGFLSRFKDIFNTHILRPPRLAYASLVLLLCVGALYGYAFFSRPAYFPLAQIQFYETGVVRGAGIRSKTLKTGWQYFEQNQYTRAISSLKKFLADQPNHYQANFLVGLSYLFEARKQLLGLPYRFDSKMVNQGVGYLEKALSLAEGNAFYQEDCLWYLGKAYLMLGNFDNARQQFQALLNLPRPNLMRKDAARKMVLKLNEFSGI